MRVVKWLQFWKDSLGSDYKWILARIKWFIFYDENKNASSYPQLNIVLYLLNSLKVSIMQKGCRTYGISLHDNDKKIYMNYIFWKR